MKENSDTKSCPFQSFLPGDCDKGDCELWNESFGCCVFRVGVMQLRAIAETLPEVVKALSRPQHSDDLSQVADRPADVAGQKEGQDEITS